MSRLLLQIWTAVLALIPTRGDAGQRRSGVRWRLRGDGDSLRMWAAQAARVPGGSDGYLRSLW